MSEKLIVNETTVPGLIGRKVKLLKAFTGPSAILVVGEEYTIEESIRPYAIKVFTDSDGARHNFSDQHDFSVAEYFELVENG